ncbi:DUF6221 family protein [Cellulosimicrobium sp. SH8]|uniref:DUF6221 family protein n=1 Tax=Cellulosimicrobium sp. SH8 TaxID=2952936 RepID=UPI0021F29654|nr:DUF6221 family protein [Cellulosimicrobium sp. SH8]
MIELYEFLLARLDEEEACARSSPGPARLREVVLETAAMSRETASGLLRLYEDSESLPHESSRVAVRSATHAILLQMVRRYADHPDYDGKWGL